MDRLPGSANTCVLIIVTTLSASCFLSCNSPEDKKADQPPAQAPQAEAPTSFLERSLTVGAENYRYTVSVPPTWHQKQTWPIIVFLHGLRVGHGGKRHDGHGFGKALRKRTPPVPVVIVFPQCPLPHLWHEPAMQTMVMQVLQQTMQEFHGDARRVYLIGHSLGGIGVWAIAQTHPSVFAALVPIASSVHLPNELPCGLQPCDPATENPYSEVAQKIGRTPVWMFHGAKDRFVPVAEARELFNTLRLQGTNVRYTEYSELGHRCWKRAYAEPGLWRWLLAQHLEP